MVKHLTLLFILLIGTVSCQNITDTYTSIDPANGPHLAEVHADSSITTYPLTDTSAGEAVRGMKITEFKRIFSQNGFNWVKKQGSDYGLDDDPSDTSAYGWEVKDKDSILFFAWSKDDHKTLTNMIIVSPKFQTKTGIHIGMSVRELKSMMSDFSLSKAMVSYGTIESYSPKQYPHMDLVFYMDDKKGPIGKYPKTGPLELPPPSSEILHDANIDQIVMMWRQ